MKNHNGLFQRFTFGPVVTINTVNPHYTYTGTKVPIA